MVKSVRFKNIVIFSMSIFSFFGSSAFGMEEFFYLFDCCVFKAENLAVLSKKTFKQKKEDEKSIEKYLGGVRIIDLPYDCMTEVVSFLKQKEAVGLRSVNKSFAKSVDRSPTVKLKEKLWLNVKNIDCFIKSFLLSDMKNKKFKIIDIWCRPSEKLDFSQNSISKINSVSEKVSLVVDGSKKRYSNSLKSYIAFFASSVDFFLNKDKTILSSGGLDKKASLVYLQNLFIQKSSDFGKTDIKFPSGLKEIVVYKCKNFGVNKIVFPGLEMLKVDWCNNFGVNKINFSSGLKKLKVKDCNSFGKKEMIFPSGLKKMKVDGCSNFGVNKEMIFPSGLEKMKIEGCWRFGVNKIVFPSEFERLKIRRCSSFGKKEVVFPSGFKDLDAWNCSSFGKKVIVFLSGFEKMKVDSCDSFGRNNVIFPTNFRLIQVGNCRNFNNDLYPKLNFFKESRSFY